ncbi:MAG: sigma-70 family RNA polymerase sigma factor [Planctomycetota bacterium]|nr:sigma-70 family RNA polymerase sigma factor [Planctomycetota bacterium]
MQTAQITQAQTPQALFDSHIRIAEWLSQRSVKANNLYEYDADAIKQAALVGLWKAAIGFRPEMGKFAPYAFSAIRRALRLEHWQRQGKLERRLRERTIGRTVSCDAPLSREDEGATLVTTLEDPRAGRDQRLRDDHEQVAALLGRLPPRLLRLVRAYYFDDRTLEEIGALEGVTHERVRQMILDALDRLRIRQFARTP